MIEYQYMKYIKTVPKAETLKQSPKIFRTLTGITPEKFDEICEKLVPLYEKYEIKRLSRPNRQRAISINGKYKLSLEDKLLMLLMYYRLYVNHIFLGFIFNINNANVSRNINPLQPLLANIFKIPERKIEMAEEEIMEIIIDATEQETQRRKGSGFSGKKKRNTIKTQIVVTPEGKIKSISKSVKGNIHDKKLYDNTKIFASVKVKKKADLGYVGTSCQTQFKKQKGKELTNKEKEFNKQFSKERIVVEHVLAHVKKFKILGDKFRNNINTYNLIFKNIAGIRNMMLVAV